MFVVVVRWAIGPTEKVFLVESTISFVVDSVSLESVPVK